MDWILLNKDTPFLEFSTQEDEFGDVMALERTWFSSLRPIGYKSLLSFLEGRRAPKHRKHIEQLLAQYGCRTLDGFLQVSHTLSLNDTFWVKPADSQLCWRDVSLYQNDFDEIIAEAALNGSFSEQSLSSTSPEFVTDGYYAKCWKRESDGIYLYKAGSATYELEPLSEYLAAQISSILCPGAVPYDMQFHHGRLVSTCPLFTSESIGLAKTAAITREERSISGLLEYFRSIGSEDAFRRMMILDAIILNTDRHLGNFGVLFDTDTMQVTTMAPVFDNNRSLLFDLDAYQLEHAERYIARLTPRLGSDFIVVARALMTDKIRNDLKNLYGFAFREHPQIPVADNRLEKLSSVVNGQIQQLI
ncbi:HipA protein [Allofournierella sp. CML151]|uniref:HipA protein n=1 Tax=Allofournierella sp. CML151 TaxID=2998082 RepID=UPI0022EA6310|nr:HipA protein [Fournierella sp. CML151]